MKQTFSFLVANLGQDSAGHGKAHSAALGWVATWTAYKATRAFGEQVD